MSWFKQMWSSKPIAGMSGQDAAGINDSNFGTAAAILNTAETRSPSSLGVAGSGSTDETKRRQLTLLESYVARFRIR